jgi:hypothetical protein
MPILGSRESSVALASVQKCSEPHNPLISNINFAVCFTSVHKCSADFTDLYAALSRRSFSKGGQSLAPNSALNYPAPGRCSPFPLCIRAFRLMPATGLDLVGFLKKPGRARGIRRTAPIFVTHHESLVMHHVRIVKEQGHFGLSTDAGHRLSTINYTRSTRYALLRRAIKTLPNLGKCCFYKYLSTIR